MLTLRPLTALLPLLLLSTPALAAPAFLMVFPDKMTARELSPYSGDREWAAVENFRIPIDPVHFDHEKIYQHLEARFDTLLTQGVEGVVLAGYSSGGKFAARLAREHQGVRALLLLDPVDGGAPVPIIDKLYPVFMNRLGPKITVPTYIAESEMGPQRGRFGVSCVPPGMGSPLFASRVEPSALTHKVIAGAGHLDFLAPPHPLTHPVGDFACGVGTRQDVDVVKEVMFDWKGELDKL